MAAPGHADIIVHNAKIATNAKPGFVAAIALSNGKIRLAGSDDELLRLQGSLTNTIDARGRTIIPGLIDSQGEYFVRRYGEEQAPHTPPIRRMLDAGLPVGAGTDATRVSSYNPFVALYWMITGKTVGGTTLYSEDNRLTREEALRLYTVGSSWFSSDDGKKGSLVPGQLADFSLLSADYFSVPEEQIKDLESVLTIVGGRVVYAADEFKHLGPPPLPVSPGWSPVRCDVRNNHRSPAEHPVHHQVIAGDTGSLQLHCDCAFE